MTATSYPEYNVPEVFPAGQVLVFGASGGLGGAIAQAFAARGSAVVASYNRGEARAKELVAAIEGRGGQATARHAAIEDPASVAAFVQAAAEAGPIHSVVFASGPHIYLEPIAKTDPARLRAYVETDLMGFTHIAQACIPHLRQSRGSITALVTCAVRGWLPHDVLSILPKAGVWALIRGLAREEGPKGVRANAIGVGVIDAGMTERGRATGQFDDGFFEGVGKMAPLRRIGSREDVAEAAVFLASNSAAYVTGQLLNVDGGLGH